MPSRKQNLEIVYQRALDTIADGDWLTAERILHQLQRVEPNYRDTVKMLRFVQATLAAQQSAAASQILDELPMPGEPAAEIPVPKPRTTGKAKTADLPAPSAPPAGDEEEKKRPATEIKKAEQPPLPKKGPSHEAVNEGEEITPAKAITSGAAVISSSVPPSETPSGKKKQVSAQEPPSTEEEQPIEATKRAEVEEFLHELVSEEPGLPVEEPPAKAAFHWTRRTFTLIASAGLMIIIGLIYLGTVLSNSKPLTMQEKMETLAPPSPTIIPTTGIPGLAPPTSTATPLPPTETFTPLPPSSTPTITPTLGIGSTLKSETDGMMMVYIPAGEFLMGPAKIKVYLDAFWIDQTEVSNAMYKLCVDEGACPPPSRETYKNPDYAQHPVIWVNWFQAQAYCHWTNQRLPSEAEWEKAARGTDGRLYPWGNDPPASNLVNICDENCSYIWKDKTINDGYKKTIPVGTLLYGASPYGALDMAGNVWEWTADWFDEKYYFIPATANPHGAQLGRTRVIRGGSWTDLDQYIQNFHRDDLVPQYTLYNIGFRCALTP
jgi:formylglycine-generating enzyme required for sulfatase activity